MVRIARLSLLFGILVIMAGQGAPAVAEGGRTLTVAQMVFLGDVPYATSYSITLAPGYSSGGATIYKFTGSAYVAGDLGKLTEMGFDLGQAAGRLVFGALAPATVLLESATLAFVSGPVMAEGRYDLGSFGKAVQHLMLDPAQNKAHGHLSLTAVAPAINMVGDITAPISATATYDKEKVTGLVQYGAQLTAELKFKHKQHDRRDPELEGSVYVRTLTLTVLSQTEWTFSGELVAALHVDP
jgi:hypothetical protein